MRCEEEGLLDGALAKRVKESSELGTERWMGALPYPGDCVLYFYFFFPNQPLGDFLYGIKKGLACM